MTEPQQPAGARNSATRPGSTGGSGTPNSVLPSAISGIVLGAGQRSIDNDFGETTGAPDLRVAKAAVEPRFVVGRAGHYAITVRNAGDGPTDAAFTVSDRLPAGLTLAAVPAGDGWTCSDPQDAGFGSESRIGKRLADWDELIGAEFVGLALQRDWGARVALDFELADGRPVRLDFMHFGSCQVPELSMLLKARLMSVTHETGKFDSVDMVFDNGQRLAVSGCVPNGGVIGPKPRRR